MTNCGLSCRAQSGRGFSQCCRCGGARDPRQRRETPVPIRRGTGAFAPYNDLANRGREFQPPCLGNKLRTAPFVVSHVSGVVRYRSCRPKRSRTSALQDASRGGGALGSGQARAVRDRRQRRETPVPIRHGTGAFPPYNDRANRGREFRLRWRGAGLGSGYGTVARRQSAVATPDFR
jgi:hypothetical protein